MAVAAAAAAASSSSPSSSPSPNEYCVSWAFQDIVDKIRKCESAGRVPVLYTDCYPRWDDPANPSAVNLYCRICLADSLIPSLLCNPGAKETLASRVAALSFLDELRRCVLCRLVGVPRESPCGAVVQKIAAWADTVKRAVDILWPERPSDGAGADASAIASSSSSASRKRTTTTTLDSGDDDDAAAAAAAAPSGGAAKRVACEAASSASSDGCGSGDVFPLSKICRKNGDIVLVDGARVMGDECEVHSNHCLVMGERARVYGNYNRVFGRGAIVYGVNNKVYGQESTDFGEGTEYSPSRGRFPVTLESLPSSLPSSLPPPLPSPLPPPLPPRPSLLTTPTAPPPPAAAPRLRPVRNDLPSIAFATTPPSPVPLPGAPPPLPIPLPYFGSGSGSSSADASAASAASSSAAPTDRSGLALRPAAVVPDPYTAEEVNRSLGACRKPRVRMRAAAAAATAATAASSSASKPAAKKTKAASASAKRARPARSAEAAAAAAAAAVIPTSDPSVFFREAECVVCMESPPDVGFIDCLHLCVCKKCWAKMAPSKSRHAPCPLCNESVTAVVNVDNGDDNAPRAGAAKKAK